MNILGEVILRNPEPMNGAPKELLFKSIVQVPTYPSHGDKVVGLWVDYMEYGRQDGPAVVIRFITQIPQTMEEYESDIQIMLDSNWVSVSPSSSKDEGK